MTLICVRPFGRFNPGDEIDVPDGAVFDTAYFAEKPKPKGKGEASSTKENKE